jgi:hypothetical protein
MVSGNLGRSNYIVGSTIYAGTDYAGGVYKSTDQGLTWTDLKAPGDKISWLVATATTLYASNDRSAPHVYHAALANDEVWVDDGAPGMVHGGGPTRPACSSTESTTCWWFPQSAAECGAT